jgi:peroxiredoxin Q/BCP
MLKPGDKAPMETEIHDSEGNPVKLKDIYSDYVVLYFYPKDDTPGCTTEACSFRDDSHQIEKLGARVIGVSKDGQDSHQKFADKHKLNFPLWSDSDLKLAKKFGAWGEKNMFGKKFMGVTRSTFIIRKDGEIVKVWEEVKPGNHSQEVIAALSDINR